MQLVCNCILCNSRFSRNSKTHSFPRLDPKLGDSSSCPIFEKEILNFIKPKAKSFF